MSENSRTQLNEEMTEHDFGPMTESWDRDWSSCRCMVIQVDTGKTEFSSSPRPDRKVIENEFAALYTMRERSPFNHRRFYIQLTLNYMHKRTYTHTGGWREVLEHGPLELTATGSILESLARRDATEIMSQTLKFILARRLTGPRTVKSPATTSFNYIPWMEIKGWQRRAGSTVRDNISPGLVGGHVRKGSMRLSYITIAVL